MTRELWKGNDAFAEAAIRNPHRNPMIVSGARYAAPSTVVATAQREDSPYSEALLLTLPCQQTTHRLGYLYHNSTDLHHPEAQGQQNT